MKPLLIQYSVAGGSGIAVYFLASLFGHASDAAAGALALGVVKFVHHYLDTTAIGNGPAASSSDIPKQPEGPAQLPNATGS